MMRTSQDRSPPQYFNDQWHCRFLEASARSNVYIVDRNLKHLTLFLLLLLSCVVLSNKLTVMSHAICPRLQATGVCRDETCTLSHGIVSCQPCQRMFSNSADYVSHIKTKKHKNAVAGINILAFCPICRVCLPAPTWSTHHIVGKRHRARIAQERVGVEVTPEEVPAAEGQRRCDVCDCVIDEQQWDVHVRSAKHRTKEQFTSFRSAFDDAAKDKHGVSLSHLSGLDFGVVEPQIASRGVSIDIVVQAVAPDTNIRILDIQLSSACSSSRVSSS